MASYLLLRSNKETGPYSLDDLVKNGLKPYDLVWVQGKSAAWRYPSEIPELKPYAPGVEEQPYDRFYKKNTQSVTEESIIAEEKTHQKVAVEEQSAFEEKYANYIPKKSVFVTLPGQKSAVAVQRPSAEPKPVPVAEPVISVIETPVTAQVKYSQPLDEIKEMYVKTLQERKTKIARKGFMLSNLKKAAVIAALVLSGILGGYLLKSNSGDKQLAAAVTTTKQSTQTIADAPQTTAVAPGSASPVQPSTETHTTVPNTQTTRINQQSDIAVPAEKAMPPAIKERLIKQEKQQYEQSKQKKQASLPSVIKESSPETLPSGKIIENDPITGERNRQVRNSTTVITTSPSPTTNQPEAKATMKPRKNGLENLVAVTSNDYTRVAFGGIRNLELTVTNDSKYIIDKVAVELAYLKPNELPLRTETVFFHTISPNGSSTLKIPDTNRGIKVSYKIVDIQSAQSETALGF